MSHGSSRKELSGSASSVFNFSENGSTRTRDLTHIHLHDKHMTPVVPSQIARMQLSLHQIGSTQVQCESTFHTSNKVPEEYTHKRETPTEYVEWRAASTLQESGQSKKDGRSAGDGIDNSRGSKDRGLKSTKPTGKELGSKDKDKAANSGDQEIDSERVPRVEPSGHARFEGASDARESQDKAHERQELKWQGSGHLGAEHKEERQTVHHAQREGDRARQREASESQRAQRERERQRKRNVERRRVDPQRANKKRKELRKRAKARQKEASEQQAEQRQQRQKREPKTLRAVLEIARKLSQAIYSTSQALTQGFTKQDHTAPQSQGPTLEREKASSFSSRVRRASPKAGSPHRTADAQFEELSTAKVGGGLIHWAPQLEANRATGKQRPANKFENCRNSRLAEGRESRTLDIPPQTTYTKVLNKNHRSTSSPRWKHRAVPEALTRRRKVDPPSADAFDLLWAPATYSKGHRLGYELLIVEPEVARSPPVQDSPTDNTEEHPFVRGDRMKSHVEVLSTPTADTRGFALMLEFADKRYVIGNAHEGLQRAIIQRGKKLQKLTDVFLAGKTEWQNTGGLLGMVLTCADGRQSARDAAIDSFRRKRDAKLERLRFELSELPEGSKQHLKKQHEYGKEETAQARAWSKLVEESAKKTPLGIHGGPNISYTVATARRFIFRKGMPLHVRECTSGADPETWKPSFSDENIRVYDMPLHPETPVSETIIQSRKRSFQDYLEKQGLEVAEYEPEHQLKITQSVVGDMFDSDWTLDTLQNIDLSAVKMPAKIFVKDNNGKLKEWTGPKPGDVPADELPKVSVYVRKPWPGALVKTLPKAYPSPVAMSYIFKNHPQRGRFLRAKAEELQVPLTRYRELTAGKSVVLENGQEVMPEDVLEPGKPGGGFAMIDIPSEEYIKPLTQRKEWDSSELMEGVYAIFWNIGPGLGGNQDLARFMKRFDKLRHVISSPDYCPNYLAFEASASATLRLAELDPFGLFPTPVFSNDAKDFPVTMDGVTLAHPGQMLDLEPNMAWADDCRAKPLDTVRLVNSISPEVKAVARQVLDLTQRPEERKETESQALPGLDNELITLGTGSAAPSKYRNVSATLLRVPGVGSYLFDAGENTLGQLARIYPPSELQEVLRDLRLVWISHLHADHHLGLTSVLKAWYKAKYPEDVEPGSYPSKKQMGISPETFLNRAKLAVVSEPNMIDWLSEYSQIEDFGWDHMVGLRVGLYNTNDGTRFYHEDTAESIDFRSSSTRVKKALSDLTGLVDLQAVHVAHCHNARAVSMTFEDGFKISYSGDCRPSGRFVEIGQGSTVLLHEATFDDELVGDAKAKKHSTTSEAIKVGLEMRAPRIMLTHFSQRYQKMPNMSGIQGRQIGFEDVEESSSVDLPVEEVADTAPLEDADLDSTRRGEVANSDDTMEVLQKDVQEANEDEHSGGNKEAMAEPSEQANRNMPRSNTTSTDLDGGALEGVKIGVAFDYLRVKVRDIALLERLSPVFTKLFDDDEASKDSQKNKK